MSDTDSTSARIARIQTLAEAYFALDPKALIERHEERLHVFDIQNSPQRRHPHAAQRVYISRKALKHFVERRKEELLRKHSKDEAIQMINFALSQIPVVLSDFDTYEYQPADNKHFYSKSFQSIGEPSIRILVEEYEGNLEIRSFHFRKPDKK